jgi:hypothetical protein
VVDFVPEYVKPLEVVVDSLPAAKRRLLLEPVVVPSAQFL